MASGFHADLDQLREVVDRLAARHDALADLDEVLTREVALLHETWDGAAASAHLVAQAGWEQGFASMRAALADLRAAAATAQENYVGAAEANVAMWRHVG